MTLKMARPFRHPKSKIFYLRRALPKDLQNLLGKREEKRSLGTRDPEQAKRRHAEEWLKCEARWASLRAGARSLTEREAHELAKPLHDRWLEIYGDHPSLQLIWRPEWFDRLWSEPDPFDNEDGAPETFRVDQRVIPAMRRYCIAQTQFLIEDEGLNVDELSHFLLQRAVAAAFQRASLTLRGVAQGTIDPQVFARTMSTIRASGAEETNNEVRDPSPAAPLPSPPANTLTSLFEKWWNEAKATGKKPSTYQSYRGTVRSFATFVGHEDPARITVADVIGFKDHRLRTVSAKTGRAPSAKTVKDSDLAALKTVFGWAVSNQLMNLNPAAGITLKLSKRPKLRPKGFTDEEARALLRATLNLMPGAEAPRTAAAKRWVHWLCAFTGARVGEMAQMRKEDLRQQGSLWVLRVTPEAGTVKTNEARDVVLHRQLVAQGFPEFVASCEDGPLFVSVGEDGTVLGPLQGLKNRLREFSRSIVTDKNVQPTHGWRHRLSTIAMEVGIEHRVVKAIQGHAASDVSENYGDVTIKTIAAAIERLPDIDLEEPSVNVGLAVSSASGDHEM